MIHLAHFVTHPIQYFVPLYRELARIDSLSLTVLFGSEHGTRPSFDHEFGQPVHFDLPLLEGYRSVFVPNRGSGVPSGHYGDFDCPSLAEHLARGRFHALWVHGWGYKAQWQAIRAARSLRIPYLVRGETTPLNDSATFWRRLARKLVVGRMLRRAAGCLYIGQNNRRFLEQMGVPDSRLFPAHYSIDVAGFQSVAAACDRRRVRTQFGADDQSFVVVTSAKAVPRKRIGDLIEAVARVEARALLWVVGDGPDRPLLEDLSRTTAPGRVTWHGFVNQSRMPELLAAADVFVLASDEETWGLAVNEAMACGLPIICSDRVGCAADLVIAGHTGFVYPSGNVGVLVQRLQTLVNQPDCRDRMGQEAFDLVTRQFSTQTTARQIAAAVQTTVARALMA